MILKYFSKDFKITSIILIIIFLIDRISKEYIIFLGNQNYNSEIYLSSFLNIILIWNDGIAFGLLSFEDKTIYNYITILISSVVIILLFLISRTKKFKKFSYIIITGGALGNLFDRIIYNSVPDFIDLHYNGFHWFVFNVADIFITIGIICLIYDEIFLEKKDK
tara:strand:+ start:926 stop:1417 length:492 start_codon:yes stop_codon:yes gene_type:complete